MGIVSRHVQASPPVSQQLKLFNIEDPAAYIQFFSGTLNFASSPGSQGPQRAGCFYCSTTRGAWLRPSCQVRENLVGPESAIPVLVEDVVKVYGVALFG